MTLLHCTTDLLKMFLNVVKPDIDGNKRMDRLCCYKQFFGESPPDIHPNGFWENNLPASDGKTYLGMVTRDNDTYESVTQRLSKPMKAGKCYAITVHLARAERYVSHSRMTSDETNYSTPVTLRIWGVPPFVRKWNYLLLPIL